MFLRPFFASQPARLLLAAAVIELAACSSDPRAGSEQAPQTAPPADYTARLLPNSDGTFGYEIYQHNKALIRQPNIPGQAGTRGFADSVAARRVARLVQHKLQRGLMPPTVTPHELDSLGALK